MDAKAPATEDKLLPFIESLFEDAIDARDRLRESDDDDCKIKDRITCLKYLEEIAKTYIVLRKAATDDPTAAGATVRKYATAFTTKNATGGGKKGKRKLPAAEPDESDSDGDQLGFDT
jgi:hypothetical protein